LKRAKQGASCENYMPTPVKSQGDLQIQECRTKLKEKR